ncbi:Glycoprotein precursor [Icoaraci virus]|uniref:Envelopment polyprotein n=2 Tax=Icoaraci virus TaxID=426790 RepID=A0A4P8D7V5_9VIRU|nr:Glycoprotein precursor [Icoaraci virus]QCI62746.1 Glycoprotein precursor [Icoaraci virus]
MNFYYFLISLVLAGRVNPLIRLSSRKSSYLGKVCFSPQTPSDGVMVYWLSEISKLSPGPLDCSRGEGDYRKMDRKEMSSQMVGVVESAAQGLDDSFGCLGENEGIEIISDQIRSEPKPMIVNCDSGLFQEEVRVIGLSPREKPKIVVNPKDSVIAVNNDTKEKIADMLKQDHNKKEKLLAEALEEIKKIRSSHGLENSKKEDELDRLLGEKTRLEGDLNREKSLSTRLENELAIMKDEIFKREERARAEKRKADMQKEIDVSKKNPKFLRPPSAGFTTIAPAIMIGLLSASVVSPQMLAHVNNRPDKGKFTLDNEEDTGKQCTSVDYGSDCKTLTTLLQPGKYPFFMAHSQHQSLIESINEDIVSVSSDGFCNHSNGAAVNEKCNEERAHLRHECPPGFQSMIFLGSDGMVKGTKCPKDYEVTADCQFCKKLKSDDAAKANGYVLHLQDVFCQTGGQSYTLTPPAPKGYCTIGEKAYKRCVDYESHYERIPFITMPVAGKIYLDTLEMKNTEEDNRGNFLCYSHIGQHQTSGSITDTESGVSQLKKVNPDACSSSTSKCVGDAVYCTRHKCVEHKPLAYCMVRSGAGPIRVRMGGEWVSPSCVGYETVLVTKPLVSSPIKPVGRCSACISECQKDGILIRTSDSKVVSAVACSGGHCVSSHQKPDMEIKIEYPGMLQSTGGSVGVHLSYEGQAPSDHITVHCNPVDPCIAHDCYICAHGLINYQCHTTASAFVVVTLIVGTLWMVVSISLVLLRYLGRTPGKLKSPAKWVGLLIMWVYGKIRKAISDHQTELNRRIGWEGDVERGPNRPDVVVRNPNRQARIMPGGGLVRYSTYMAMIMVLIPGAMSCSETVLASSKIKRCFTESNKDRCILSGSVLMRAGPIGSSSCLLIQGLSENQKEFVSIRTASSELVCREGQGFWTTLYKPKCMSSRRCHLVGECHGNTCQSWNETRLSSEFSGLDNNKVMQENKCFEQCGGIGCGCFNINPSCLMVHTELSAVKPEAIRVFSCSDWIHKVELQIKVPDLPVQTVSLGALSTVSTPWGSIGLGLDAEGITGSNSYSFMKSSSGEFALLDEGLSMIPRRGFIGEIRCPNEAATLAASSSCVRADDLIKYRPMTDTIDCTSSLVDPFLLFNLGMLPQSRNGKTFTKSKDGTTVQAMSSSVVEASLSLNFDNLEVEFVVNQPDCTATFLNISGCYSCNAGARVCLQIKTNKQGTFIANNEDNTVHFMSNVVGNKEIYCSVLHFSRPRVEENMEYTCGRDKKPLIIRGNLIALDLITGRNQTGGSSVVINPKTGSWSLGNWVMDFSDWMGGPLRTIAKAAIMVLLSVIALILIWNILKLIIQRMLENKWRKDR